MKKKLFNLFKLLLALNLVAAGFFKPGGLAFAGDLLLIRGELIEANGSGGNENKTILLPGKNIAAEIHIDSLGIPHIYSTGSNSSAFTIGYMQARDRYFQMELMIRTVKGELASVFGRPALQSDIFWKPYEFEKKAIEMLNELKKDDPVSYDYLAAYASGINYFLSSQKPDQLPVEYKLFNFDPHQWEEHDSFLVAWYMSWTLTYKDDHIDRQTTLDLIPEEIKSLYATNSPGYTYILRDSITLPDSLFPADTKTDVQDAGENSASIPERNHDVMEGSNNWAISSEISANGNAILCNDPHLGLTLPCAWYEMHVHQPGENIYGFSLPGIPYIIAGHNDHISWGITNGNWDVIDKYELTCNHDTGKYKSAGKWEEFSEKEFVIKLPGGKDTVITQKYSLYGLVYETEHRFYAVRWHAAKKTRSFISFFSLAHAQNWNDFEKALSTYAYPALNFAYADCDGNVGIIAAGELPLRPASYSGGISSTDMLPDDKIVPFQYMPKSYKPLQHYVSSANQLPAKTNFYFNYNNTNNYRPQRINELLESKSGFTINDLMAYQNDITDISLPDMKALITKYRVDSQVWNITRSIMAWDGSVATNRPEPIVYEELKFVVTEKLTRLMKSSYNINLRPTLNNTLSFLLHNDTIPLSGKKLPTREFLETCLKQSLDNLQLDYGARAGQVPYSDYKYGGASVIDHIAKLPLCGAPVKSRGGNNNTINVNATGFGPTFRLIAEMARPVHCYAVLEGGQSGRLNSPNYSDQLEIWQSGKYRECQSPENPKQLKNIITIIKIN